MPFRSRAVGSPGEELDYAEITAPVAPATTTEGTAVAVVTGASVVCDGLPVFVDFYSPAVRADSALAGRSITLVLLVDAVVQDGVLAKVVAATAAAGDVPVRASRRLTPSAGAHTFSVKAFVSAGTGNIDAGTGGTGASVSAFLRVVRA